MILTGFNNKINFEYSYYRVKSGNIGANHELTLKDDDI